MDVLGGWTSTPVPLGDLSGGQAIATMMARHYGLTADQLGMYRFEGIEKPKRYKDGYRRTLDALGLAGDEEDAFIYEASLGFRLNRAMFRELDRLSRQLSRTSV